MRKKLIKKQALSLLFFYSYTKTNFIAYGIFFIILSPTLLSAQKGELRGSFQMDAQYYKEDSLIGSPNVPQSSGLDGYLNLIYTYGSLEAGLRYEAYLPPVLGKDNRLEGHGFANRYLKYAVGELEVTAGNFYEQFGNGLIFRAYEEWNLAYDNSVDGIRLKYNPVKGVNTKFLYGKQRFFWDYSPGIIRGGDAEFSINEIIGGNFEENKNKIIVGASALSKFQTDRDPIYKLPQNVMATSGRANYNNGVLNLGGEYAYKVNDPSASNNMIYKNGEALLLNASWSKKGIGILLSAKRIDNMDFRSDRTATGSTRIINFLPPTTMQHAYAMPAMYPYATQPNGEMGMQAQLMYLFKKDTPLGGKYGTRLSLHYAIANSIHKEKANDTSFVGQPGTLGYKSSFFRPGNEKYFEDVSVQVYKRLSKDIRANFMYTYLSYNIDVIEGHAGDKTVHAHVGVADISKKISQNKSLRFELQHLYTTQDKKSWASALIEYAIAPKWFFSIGDQYNYGNDDPKKRLHYYTASMGHTKGATRIALSYGRQREGVICVGGVCRNVPASNGLALSVTAGF